ncbi:hypothetical protein [Streptomyces pristinaespiralis]|uniref:hypothetical protein n=1 Tax=Streptomyces pristinaespiralis TaxID=38300 RepID=UPI0034096263
MSRKPVIPKNVYQPMAQHMPVEQYHAAPVCQCGHGHPPAPAQTVIIKQADPWARYVALGFAGAGIGLMFLVGLVVTLIAAGVCALCVAVAIKSLRGIFRPKSKPRP